MKVKVSSNFNISAEQAWQLVQQSDTLLYVTRGLLGFQPLESELPEKWRSGITVPLRIVLFSLIPAWRHEVRFVSVSEADRQILTNESGGAIKTWDHLATVKPTNEGRCTYSDEIEVDAGLLTPLIWLYANAFYRYRHLRWRRLIKKSLK